MRATTSLGMAFGAALFAQAANGEPARLGILGGLVTFQMPENWLQKNDPDYDILIEPVHEGDTDIRCSVRVMALPPLPPEFHNQSTVNGVFSRHYHETPPTDGETYTYRRFEEKSGVAISRAGRKYDGIHFEMMQFNVFKGTQAHAVQTDCLAIPDATPEFLLVAGRFLDSMQITTD